MIGLDCLIGLGTSGYRALRWLGRVPYYLAKLCGYVGFRTDYAVKFKMGPSTLALPAY